MITCTRPILRLFAIRTVVVVRLGHIHIRRGRKSRQFLIPCCLPQYTDRPLSLIKAVFRKVAIGIGDICKNGFCSLWFHMITKPSLAVAISGKLVNLWNRLLRMPHSDKS